MTTAHALQFKEYDHTDLAKSSAVTSLDLNDGSSWQLLNYIPVSSSLDMQTGEYPDVWDTAIIQFVPSATVDNKWDAYNSLTLWQRKCRNLQQQAGVGNEIWLYWKHQSATNASYVKVKAIHVQLLGDLKVEIRILREGLWWGARATATISNEWNTAAASAITIQNHMDELSHVFDCDNGGGTPAYSGNKPTYLLDNALDAGTGAITEVGDCVYFGNTHGPFYGFTVDIATGAVYNATLVWQYYQGGATPAWATFTPTDTTTKLTATGIKKVSWAATAVATWAASTINAVEAHWVRLIVTVFTSGTSSAVTQNSVHYFGVDPTYRSSHANYVKVAAANVDGDAPALCQIMIQSTTSAASVTRVAKRSIGTADTNTRYIGDVGNTANTTCWGGFKIAHATPGTSWANGSMEVTIDADNLGMWRALARAYCASPATTAQLRTEVYLNTSNSVAFTGQTATMPVHSQWCITDLGMVNIVPPLGHTPENYRVRAEYRRSSGGTKDIDEDLLILLPTDEFYHVAETASNNTSYKLVLSGIDQQVFVSSAASSGIIYERCEPMGQPLTLEPNRDNYFFFLCDRASDVNTLTDEYSVTLYVIPRYVHLRGTG